MCVQPPLRPTFAGEEGLGWGVCGFFFCSPFLNLTNGWLVSMLISTGCVSPRNSNGDVMQSVLNVESGHPAK